ncbi:YbgC/FadM family acyl-CoA thioesterase [Acinetobacter cumulans]|uniref:YbgC/FadM family acyl-CoA thioesterase n=2 Tax=Acinetobacter cumulans TaxID=2136182 RepID=A0A498CZ16_9GAMM|nr:MULTISPECIES: thioesterase family protein [Acinetobacter]RKG42496.1 acyl-CoA thioesterase [Acinetobacter cumulans]RLL34174.1 YbgC/FadM family acyl-CoA thioesterase [Acinetobacter cumulans]RLL39457.1 YbgC/FadM family acyl-CoA thioesterase [Acinetobacter cumulans]RZG58337.1 acyl-CoA thioesterase [Acinetobacter sp. WCHAc060006]
MDLIKHYPIILKQVVAWGDMDAFGHVNNTVYYRYMESARILYFDALDIFSTDVFTVVASSQCQYLKPVFYPDTLSVATRIEELRNSALRMSYVLWSEKQQAVIAQGEAVIVCVDKINMKKTAIPERVRLKMKEIELSVSNII